MSIDLQKVGNQIAYLRKKKGLTQQQLAERLSVSFQAVSKWERAGCLPDTALLVDLADILETSVDFILTAGEKAVGFSGRITVENMRDGLLALRDCGELLGRDNLIYQSAIRGIDSAMNTDIEASFEDSYVFEAFLAEAIIQNLKAGKYIDLTDVRKNFRHKHFCDTVIKYAGIYNIR